MNFKKTIGLLPLFILSVSSPLQVQGAQLTQAMGEAYKLYKKGAYHQAIEHIQPIQNDPQHKYLALYIKGICHNKLQEFDLAAEELQMATQGKDLPEDLFYELGQAYYATNDLKKAYKAFYQSAQKSYMTPTSLYYMGFIGQTLEKYDTAITSYKKINQLPDVSRDIAQASNFQMAESILAQSEKTNEAVDLIQRFVLPQYKVALKVDKDSPMATDIEQRVQEIETKYDLDETVMLNGRKMGRDPFLIRYQESFLYDSNVINEADRPQAKATHKDSFGLKGNFTTRYQFLFYRQFFLTPELKMTHDYYLRRDTPGIYRNDAYSFTPLLKSGIEHTLWGKMASFSLDLEYSYQAKDVSATKEYHFYGRSFTYSVGEKVEYFKLGETSLTLKRKHFDSQDPTNDSYTNSLGLSQTLKLPIGHVLLLSANLDFTRLPKKSIDDTDSYLLRADYIYPNFYETFGLTTGTNLTFLNPKGYKASRGLEKSFGPFIKIDHKIKNIFEMVYRYELTRNLSKDKQSYQYTKHLVAVDGQVSFKNLPFLE